MKSHHSPKEESRQEACGEAGHAAEGVNAERPTLSLGEALPLEMARVRDQVLPLYLEIGPGGAFGAAMMRMALDGAAKAMVEGDVIGMVRWMQELKEWQLS